MHQIEFRPDAPNQFKYCRNDRLCLESTWNPPGISGISGLIFFYLKFFYIPPESTGTHPESLESTWTMWGTVKH
jgi:hypothetical protein